MSGDTHQTWIVSCTCGHFRSCDTPEEANRAADVHELVHRGAASVGSRPAGQRIGAFSADGDKFDFRR